MLIDETGNTTLFVPTPTEDDPLWHGPSLSFKEKATLYGVEQVIGVETLNTHPIPKNTVSIAVPDSEKNRWLTRTLGRPFEFGNTIGDNELVSAIIGMRRAKDNWEILQLEKAAAASAKAHLAVMRATRPGASERALAAVFQGVLAGQECALAYPTILTVRGEVLHQFHHLNTLNHQDLLLIDGGGEVDSGYGVDITRTYPVSGTFDGRQKAAYEAVLEAQIQAISLCRPGVSYRKVHDAASLVLAQFLRDEGIIDCTAETAIDVGLHAIVFPHGVGHHLGLDVHDMENFGDLPSYPPETGRPTDFGTCYLRLNLPLEPGWVVTVEPGFYVVGAILERPDLREKFGHLLDFSKLEAWRGFGGIRIEDDILITQNGPRVLTEAVPKQITELESIVGQGPSVEERLGVC